MNQRFTRLPQAAWASPSSGGECDYNARVLYLPDYLFAHLPTYFPQAWYLHKTSDLEGDWVEEDIAFGGLRPWMCQILSVLQHPCLPFNSHHICLPHHTVEGTHFQQALAPLMAQLVFKGSVQSGFLPRKCATVDRNRSRTDPDIEGTEPNHLGPVFCGP
ncbi:uncharacterized protein LACBIDRAFT_310883 [Laccaria bicolor S238N-H82]|uniref:Predicted protein n=1 Tax=Laccaria bicolor (strain S238N-H82 / ATCC MYA-4686) TaxID=486041 RepID=B0DVB3_LACBS|nr:uncharacterized protein LACBIDRAFT_310883 [Laccaria bicolor S238N-H82]EDR01482.1 predicted protein [Laccaria bicolor S238N-H82]|eukprot:XP_001887834.1 predicted protein [Laccaria bicolor S238N-H82]